MAKKKQGREVEWIGGLVTLPQSVTGEGPPYQPELLCWMGPSGEILGNEIGRADEVLSAAGDVLRRTTREPMVGRAHVPSRLRVGSEELAARVRGAIPGVEVIVAPTPEIDALGAHIGRQFAPARESYLDEGITPAMMASFFAAAAELYRAKPWEILDEEIGITVEALDVKDGVLCTIGQEGEAYGVLFFRSMEEYEQHVEAASALMDGEQLPLPWHFGISFDRGADLPPAMRKEVAAHGWPVARADAYPSVMVVEPDATTRGPTARELALAEAIARAVPHLLADAQTVEDACDGGPPHACSARVSTNLGEVEVRLSVPFVHDADSELATAMAQTPEIAAFDALDHVHMLADLAHEHFRAPLTDVSATQLQRLLFEVVPRSVSIDASTAPAIVAQLRAFFTALARIRPSERADACLALLGPDAEPRLARALGDSRNFGMAKSIMMHARAAGVDISSPDAVNTFLETVDPRTLPMFAAPARAKSPKKKPSRRKRRR